MMSRLPDSLGTLAFRALGCHVNSLTSGDSQAVRKSSQLWKSDDTERQ